MNEGTEGGGRDWYCLSLFPILSHPHRTPPEYRLENVLVHNLLDFLSFCLASVLLNSCYIFIAPLTLYKVLTF